MKKNIIAIGITMFIISAILAGHYWQLSTAEQVVVYAIKETGILSSVTSNGVIEEVHKKEIYVDIPVKVDKVKVREGDVVTQGQPIITLDTRDLEMQLKQAKMNLEVEELALQQMQEQPSYFAQSERDLPPNIISVWRETPIPDVGNLNIQQKKVEIVRLELEELEARIQRLYRLFQSPMDGVITHLNVQNGSTINVMQPAVVISDLDKLQARVEIGEYFISDIEKGQNVKIYGEAFQGCNYKGKVMHISPVARQVVMGQRRDTIIDVIVEVLDTDTRLKPGYSTNVKIITDRRNNVMIIPYEALAQDEQGEDIVYVYKYGRVHKRKIVTGAELELETEILEGIEKGEKVILNPSPNIKDGLRVKVKKVIS